MEQSDWLVVGVISEGLSFVKAAGLTHAEAIVETAERNIEAKDGVKFHAAQNTPELREAMSRNADLRPHVEPENRT